MVYNCRDLGIASSGRNAIMMSGTSNSKGQTAAAVGNNQTKYVFVTSRPSTPVQVISFSVLFSFTDFNNHLFILLVYCPPADSGGKASARHPE